ncbi:MAG: DeoR/GlpR transcriptional regulator [Clostridia bacterium]|nr:DeoR/GlpR transcriptional regulator [Clostridia bacterium]
MRTDRLNQMEAFILRNGTASLYDLSRFFDISLNTVRRDVTDLIKRGRIRKVYGGVSSLRSVDSLPYTTQLPLAERAEMHAEEKRAIGRLAASLVEDGSVIFLDSGTTVPYMLPHLAGKKVRIVTHSLNVMTEAAMYPDLKVLGFGGQLNHATYSLTGDVGVNYRSIRLQTLFMAATALSVEWGASNNTYEEFLMKTELVNLHTNVVVLADSSKFGKNATYCYCPFSRIRGIVTDRRPDGDFMEAIQDNGIKLYYPEEEQSAP